MNHPLVSYELAKLKIAEDIRWAERERLVREAGAPRRNPSIDAVPFRERLARLLGAGRGTARPGTAASGA